MSRVGQALPSRPTRAALGKALGGHLPRPGARVGLLGGSFNPAHEGHAHVAEEALRRLRLDEVWLLVSPQNPLKGKDEMAPLARRLASARRWARHPRVRATAMETLLQTRMTADTLAQLQNCFPGVRFVWLMGADNLGQVHRWDRWTEIFNRVAVAVFDRPSYSLRALSSKAACRFSRQRLHQSRGHLLAGRAPPAWAFMRVRLVAQSATALRERARRQSGTGGCESKRQGRRMGRSPETQGEHQP